MYFKREMNDVVVVMDGKQVRFDHEQWASIVASVSKNGDSPEAHQQALQLFFNGVTNTGDNILREHTKKMLERLATIEKEKKSN